MPQSNLTQDSFLNTLKDLPVPQCYCVALSGGMDSVVLLHLLTSVRCSLACDIIAIHINHGLQPDAMNWQRFTETLCTKLNIELRIIQLDEMPKHSDSIEAWAREQRYRAFGTVLNKEDLLLTGHHQDDQAETLLLQLFRGAGPEGLAAMPLYKSLSAYSIARPLLYIQRQQIMQYAQQNELNWIEDKSNQNIAFDRNYLRHKVMPVLKQRWPSIDKTLQRVSSHQSEVIEILREIAELELSNISDTQRESINVIQLQKYSFSKQKLIVRYWIKQQGFPLPSERVLNQLFNSLLESDSDKLPVVNWQGCEIRRYQNRLYIMPELFQCDTNIVLTWSIQETLSLPYGLLSAELTRGGGVRENLITDNTLTVRYRTGGERLKPSGSDCHRSLKKLYQEASVLPWMRDKIPLLYKDDDLIAVPGLWVADHTSCQADDVGWDFQWQCNRRVIGICE